MKKILSLIIDILNSFLFRHMKHLWLIILFISVKLVSQTLNVPARQIASMNGSQFVSTITPLSFSARENLILQEVVNGNVPNFYRTLSAVTSTAVIGGITKSVTYYVIPDYLAIGCDSNYFLCPMSPIIATKIADSAEAKSVVAASNSPCAIDNAFA